MGSQPILAPRSFAVSRKSLNRGVVASLILCTIIPRHKNDALIEAGSAFPYYLTTLHGEGYSAAQDTYVARLN